MHFGLGGLKKSLTLLGFLIVVKHTDLDSG